MITRICCLLSLVSTAAFATQGDVPAAAQTVPAVGSTTQMQPSIWVHPSDPAKSLIFTADVSNGLSSYSLDGGAVQSQIVSTGVGGVDVRYGVVLDGGVTTSIVAVTLRASKAIDVLAVDPVTLHATSITAQPIAVLAGSTTVDKIALEQVPQGLFAWVSDSTGNFEVWQLTDNGSGKLVGTLVRSGLTLGGQASSVLVDDENRTLFATEVSTGLSRTVADPAADAGFTVVDSSSLSIDLTGAVQGISLYRAHGQGYLIVGSNGSSDFAVYSRSPSSPADFLTRFRVVPNGGISGVTSSTGQAVLSFATPQFPQGLFVAEDQTNTPNPNVKLASWGDVVDAGVFADGGHLQIVTNDDPRPALGVDGGADGGIDGGTDGGTGSSPIPPTGPGGPGGTPTDNGGCSATGGVLVGWFVLGLLLLASARRRSAPKGNE